MWKCEDSLPSFNGSRTSYVISNCSGFVKGAGLSRTFTSKMSTAAIAYKEEGKHGNCRSRGRQSANEAFAISHQPQPIHEEPLPK
jgi:hypothetical protein